MAGCPELLAEYRKWWIKKARQNGGGGNTQQDDGTEDEEEDEEDQQEVEVMPARRSRGPSDLPESKLAWEFLQSAKGWTKAKGRGHRLVGPDEGSGPMMQEKVRQKRLPIRFPLVCARRARLWSAYCCSVDGGLGWVADGFVAAVVAVVAVKPLSSACMT